MLDVGGKKKWSLPLRSHILYTAAIKNIEYHFKHMNDLKEQVEEKRG